MAKDLYRRRRERLLEKLANSRHGKGMAIVPAATAQKRSNDVDYPFHQDPDFRYLTGYPEPDAVAVLRPGAEDPFLLFVLPRDPQAETWTGRRIGVDGARDEFGADKAFPIDELSSQLSDLLKGYDALFYRGGRRPAIDSMIDSTLQKLRERNREPLLLPEAVVDIATLVHEARLVKTDEELEVLRQAVRVTVDGHRAAMRFARPGVSEHDVTAVLEYVFRRGGAEGVSYETVVAAGANACILHYTGGRDTLREGDLLLIDAGALVGGYSGDLTRTFPVSGRFDPAQRDVYSVVLEAHKRAIDAVRPGATFEDSHRAAVRAICEGLIHLGVLEGDVDQVIAKEAYKPYYMHRTGHWLGMDVHDVGRYHQSAQASRVLEPGMVLTVEPGLYLSPDDDSVPERLRGIGIRIEDDVAVTSEGNEVLSADLPLSPEEIEAVMAERLELPH